MKVGTGSQSAAPDGGEPGPIPIARGGARISAQRPPLRRLRWWTFVSVEGIIEQSGSADKAVTEEVASQDRDALSNPATRVR